MQAWQLRLESANINQLWEVKSGLVYVVPVAELVGNPL